MTEVVVLFIEQFDDIFLIISLNIFVVCLQKLFIKPYYLRRNKQKALEEKEKTSAQVMVINVPKAVALTSIIPANCCCFLFANCNPPHVKLLIIYSLVIGMITIEDMLLVNVWHTFV